MNFDELLKTNMAGFRSDLLDEGVDPDYVKEVVLSIGSAICLTRAVTFANLVESISERIKMQGTDEGVTEEVVDELNGMGNALAIAASEAAELGGDLLEAAEKAEQEANIKNAVANINQPDGSPLSPEAAKALLSQIRKNNTQN